MNTTVNAPTTNPPLSATAAAAALANNPNNGGYTQNPHPGPAMPLIPRNDGGDEDAITPAPPPGSTADDEEAQMPPSPDRPAPAPPAPTAAAPTTPYVPDDPIIDPADVFTHGPPFIQAPPPPAPRGPPLRPIARFFWTFIQGVLRFWNRVQRLRPRAVRFWAEGEWRDNGVVIFLVLFVIAILVMIAVFIPLWVTQWMS